MKSDRGDIELAGVCKSFDGATYVVDGDNLKIEDGAYCCFIGPSGCGKTRSCA
jgi:putative spermidine/putrescine transport system ATP-binding protein